MKFSKAKIFLFCCIGFIIGVAMASFLLPAQNNLNIFWFGAVIFFLINIILFYKNNKITTVAFIALFLFFGLLRFGLSIPVKTPDKAWYYNGQTVVLKGYLDKEPDIRLKNQKLDISAETITVNSEDGEKLLPQSIFGRVLVTADLYPEYKYGEEIKIMGELQAPKDFEGFSYNRYLARFDIYSVSYYPEIIKTGNSQGNLVYKKILNLKDRFRRVINMGLGEPEASLARAIVLGDKNGIPEKIRRTFSRIGLSHIIAISGMHISILAALVMGLLFGAGLSRKYAFYVATLFLIFYIILIGLPASAVRAGLMGFLVLWALYIGRLNKIINSIIFTAAVLLFFNPKLLRSDIGFQLSFLAVLGIVYAYPLIDGWLEKIKIPKAKGMRDIFGITLAAQIFTMPILMLNFSTISLIAPFSNLAVIWILPFLLAATFAALGISIIIPGLSVIFFLGTKYFILYILKIAALLEGLPFSYIEIGSFWVGWIAFFYLILSFFIINLVKRDCRQTPD